MTAANSVGSSNPKTIRIATWNVMRPPYSGTRREALLAHLWAVNADVWVLTESVRSFSPGSGYELVAASSEAPDLDPDEAWVCIWARVPSNAIDLTAEPERTACAEVRAGTHTFVIYGTVLPWATDSRRNVRGFEAFAVSLVAQSAEWRELRSKNADAALVIAGDLNQDLAPFHYYGSARGKSLLGESLRAAGLTCLTGGARDPLLRFERRASIDHICVVDSFSSEAAVAIWPSPDEVGRTLSDHFGVVATLEHT